MNQSDTWQYSTRVNPRVTSADGHHVRVSRITFWKCQRNIAIGISISRYEKSQLKSQSLNQDQIWTIDSSQWRGIRDRELDMSKKIDIRNLDIVIGEIAIESEPSDQVLIGGLLMHDMVKLPETIDGIC
jgi:hypothetical protein